MEGFSELGTHACQSVKGQINTETHVDGFKQ